MEITNIKRVSSVNISPIYPVQPGHVDILGLDPAGPVEEDAPGKGITDPDVLQQHVVLSKKATC